MITRELMQRGLIKGRQLGKEWEFWVSDGAPAEHHAVRQEHSRSALAQSQMPPNGHHHLMQADQFEEFARSVMSDHYSARLDARRIPGCPKIFDFVSPDTRTIGDAKYFTLVQGERTPPAKFSVIAEHVWLLEKITPKRAFLVFGNDRRVPEQWLSRYGALVQAVQFFFLDHEGKLDALN
jgi:hypothetical protein